MGWVLFVVLHYFELVRYLAPEAFRLIKGCSFDAERETPTSELDQKQPPVIDPDAPLWDGDDE
jgi:hypothetical protein